MRGMFHKGEKIWVEVGDGQTRPAIYVADADSSTFFGGGQLVYVVFEDTKEGAQVEMDSIIARDE